MQLTYDTCRLNYTHSSGELVHNDFYSFKLAAGIVRVNNPSFTTHSVLLYLNGGLEIMVVQL